MEEEKRTSEDGWATVDVRSGKEMQFWPLSQWFHLPKPLLLCMAFVAGLFIATISFNVLLYISFRHRYEALPPGTILDSMANLDHPKHGKSNTETVAVLPRHEGAAALDIYNNIVMIQVRFATYNRMTPWQTVRATFQSGMELTPYADASGLILEQGLILTSAYVATDNYLVTVLRQGQPREFEAEVVGVARELDVALLKVKDPAFWRETDMTIKLNEATKILGRGNKVIVAGFPVGQDLSISKISARISRVDAQAAGYGGRYGSFPQAVLSLYPKVGSDVTVGPVFSEQNDKLIGFMGRGETVVPVSHIATFLKAYRKDPTIAGLGMLGMIYRPMRNLGLRKYWDLPNDNVGVQIRSVSPSSDLHGKVEKGDMLVAIDGQAIMSNGAVNYRKSVDNLGQINDVAMPFSVLLSEKAVNETAKLTFRRAAENSNDEDGQSGYNAGKNFDIDVKMKRLDPLIPRSLDQNKLDPPTYFMIGGMVFTVFSEDLLIQAKSLGVSIPYATQANALHRWRTNPDEQILVLLKILEHPCNKWYSTVPGRILKYFNGQEVINMKQFVTLVGSAIKEEEQFLKFTFGPLNDVDTAGDANDPDIVLDSAVCAGSDKVLSAVHGIPRPVSPDLKNEYQALPAQFTQFSLDNSAVPHPEPVHLPQRKALPQKPSPVPEKKELVQEDKQSNVTQSVNELPWANVVQIRLVATEPNFLSPWNVGGTGQSRCSAIIVDKAKKRILTNSHCVANAVALDVLREDVPVPVPAKVVEIAHDVDLAWITTDSESFWANDQIKAEVTMEKGLPYLSDNVRVVGYPAGGTSISITQGIVSRLDAQTYPNGLMGGARNTPDDLLIVQVDAAINPGNSGGPVFDDSGNLIGLAFAGMFGGLQNVGYVIPNVHMQNFVAAVSETSNHRWKAQSETGILVKRVENQGLRKFLRLKDGETGVQVRSVAPGSPLAEKGVVKGDVMLKIDGLPIHGNGKVERNFNGKRVTLPFSSIVTEKQHGTSTKLEFLHVDWETGKRTIKEIDVVFTPLPPLVPRFYDAPKSDKGREHYAAKKTYFIKWGLVWGVFSNPVFAEAREVKKDVPWSVTRSVLHRWRSDDSEEAVVLLQGLGGTQCTLNYDTSTMRVLKYFNGKKVNNMLDLLKYAAEFELKGEEFMRITFAPLADEDIAGTKKDPDMVLDREFCGKVDPYLMAVNNIPQQASDDLLEYIAQAEAENKTASVGQSSLMEARGKVEARKMSSEPSNTLMMPSFSESVELSEPVVLDSMAMRTTDEFADVESQSLETGTPFEHASDLEEADATEVDFDRSSDLGSALSYLPKIVQQHRVFKRVTNLQKRLRA